MIWWESLCYFQGFFLFDGAATSFDKSLFGAWHNTHVTRRWLWHSNCLLFLSIEIEVVWHTSHTRLILLSQRVGGVGEPLLFANTIFTPPTTHWSVFSFPNRSRRIVCSIRVAVSFLLKIKWEKKKKKKNRRPCCQPVYKDISERWHM